MDRLVTLQQNIAIIPARSGSKRIPDKNIIDFWGKPMIAWTIEAAIKSNKFSRVLVSTDSEKIAKIARDFGAEVPFLRKSFSDDISPVSVATTHALEQAEANWKQEFSHVVQLMANCPLRTSRDISNALKSFSKGNRNFQISCFKFGWMNPWWSFRLGKFGDATPMFPEKKTYRSQDLEDLYCPTGSIWIAKAKRLKETQNFYSTETVFEPINWKSAVDIDDYEDLEFALAVKNLTPIEKVIKR